MTPDLSRAVVFFDFDNTITSLDVLDDLLEKFTVDEKWKALEKKWQAGKIGTKECLEGQLRSVRISRGTLEKYLAKIAIDPFFAKLLQFLRGRKIPVVIVSDNFSWIIKKILKNKGITGVRVYSNHLRFAKDRLVPSFPHQDPACPRCAHCKKKHLREHEDKASVYIGVGLSDLCPAMEADWVFAKGTLAEALSKKRKTFVSFENLEEVYHHLAGSNGNGQSKKS